MNLTKKQLEYHRQKWINRGITRPPFAKETTKDQESVWDYPRPPAILKDTRHVKVLINGTLVADSKNTMRVLETASPPTFYIPKEDVKTELLTEIPNKQSLCEWKGLATYYSYNSKVVGWTYKSPFEQFNEIASHIAFYASCGTCMVDGETVVPQPSDFYGGWVTSEVVGPFKGEPGTSGW